MSAHWMGKHSCRCIIWNLFSSLSELVKWFDSLYQIQTVFLCKLAHHGNGWSMLDHKFFPQHFFKFFLRFSTILGNAKVWRLKFVCAPSSNVCRGLILCSIYNMCVSLYKTDYRRQKKIFLYCTTLDCDSVCVSHFRFLVDFMSSVLLSSETWQLQSASWLIFFFGFSCTNNC